MYERSELDCPISSVPAVHAAPVPNGSAKEYPAALTEHMTLADKKFEKAIGVMGMEYPISLYYDTEVSDVKTLDLCRGDDDFRKIYIADDGHRKLVIKYLSNTFSDKHRIEGWFRLMDEYRKTGLYCPAVVPNRSGELLHCDTADGRDYYTYAEEYSVYETAEHIGEEKYKDAQWHVCFMPDIMRSLGKIASAGLDILDWPSACCLLEPFCAPDTTDETTECAETFVKYTRENLSEHSARAEALLKMFYERQEELRAVYHLLPTSCFQADLNDSNILLDDNNNFVGLIDFNMCGKEPILNYTVREALWGVSDKRLFGENGSRLYFYDKESDNLRIKLFLENIGYIQENYRFSEFEKSVFPNLYRYMNSFCWISINEITLIKDNENKVTQLFDWIEYQKTRNDILLP